MHAATVERIRKKARSATGVDVSVSARAVVQLCEHALVALEFRALMEELENGGVDLEVPSEVEAWFEKLRDAVDAGRVR